MKTLTLKECRDKRIIREGDKLSYKTNKIVRDGWEMTLNGNNHNTVKLAYQAYIDYIKMENESRTKQEKYFDCLSLESKKALRKEYNRPENINKWDNVADYAYQIKADFN